MNVHLTDTEREALLCDCEGSFVDYCNAHGGAGQGYFVDVEADELVKRVESIVAARMADAWDECVRAIAWCLGNGEPSAAAALAYTATNNPYRTKEGQ